jgi:sulfur carrier protein
MNITLNGTPHKLNGARTVPELLASINARPEQVAVAINGVVIRRREWAETTVAEDDVVEVVRAVGGGAR